MRAVSWAPELFLKVLDLLLDLLHPVRREAVLGAALDLEDGGVLDVKQHSDQLLLSDGESSEVRQLALVPLLNTLDDLVLAPLLARQQVSHVELGLLFVVLRLLRLEGKLQELEGDVGVDVDAHAAELLELGVFEDLLPDALEDVGAGHLVTGHRGGRAALEVRRAGD